ncbi:cytochrome c oxidase accessory protein CcoG [Reichenbachiella versicolor]|uniref:cytochrome c oxidase accessory protein CcoG n=1 Tax=Reichenbachiella versicolor TaxID=1821036 RepID=UPI000D6E222F|nr:cytochrome c oxidase accessory protein CcoG [Reichenbachiella versicolor]
METQFEYEEEYRDSISTVDEEGKRVWIYPKKPKGAFHKKRVIVTALLLSLLFLGPFLKVGGQPLLLLNFFERKFIILGLPFWPQDFFLLALLLVTLFVFIILFTVAFGRVWCGWACPQTLFMEMVFRKIEYWIEGDANQQRKLNDAPWTREKIFKKISKQTIFLLISLLISHTVMAYLIGVEEVVKVVTQYPTEHLSGFVGLMFFTGIFYWVFAFFREQACVTVCPYGRLQGVLLVKDSIAVMYDWVRGEPRERIKKGITSNEAGACIDCKLCVHVCPTGIDIRNGTQLECVNCTACMDVCDDVMTKVGRPKGLIRYASYNSVKDGISRLFTTRIAGYILVLIALVTFLSYMLVSREEIEVTILKAPGQVYEKLEDGRITNLYNIEFVNKTFNHKSLIIKTVGVNDAETEKIGKSTIQLGPNEKSEGTFIIKIPRKELKGRTMNIEIGLFDQDEKLIDTYQTKFTGPSKFEIL